MRTGWVVAAGLWILGTAASAWGGEAPATSAAPPADPAGVVAALVAAEPYGLKALEQVIGELGRDPKVWEQAIGPLDRKNPSRAVLRARVRLWIDPFHQDPQKVLDPSLESYELDFQEGREASLRLLESKLGAPVALTKDGRRTMRYGERFFLQGKAGTDEMTLLWFLREPEFAIPLRSEAETARLVADVAAILQAGLTRSAIESRFGKLSLDTGWNRDVVRGPTWELTFEPAGRPVPNEVHLNFKRAIPAAGLLPVLHVGVPRVVAFDTHMQSRHLIDYADPHPGRLRVRGYELELSVDKEGLVEASEPYHGASLIWRGNPLRFTGISAELPRAAEDP